MPSSTRRGRPIAALLALACLGAGAPVALASPASAADSPVFATQPQSATAADGEQVTFAVTYQSGVFATSRQWFLDTTDDGVQNGTAVQGATTDSLRVTAATAADGSRYYLRAQALAGGKLVTVLSESALLSVGSEPVGVAQAPADLSVQAYQRARFTARASGTSPISYQWQRATGDDWADVDGATTASYSFKTAPGDDGSRFRVVVDNPHGEPVASAAATLTVRQPSGALDTLDDAALAWSLNNIYQGGNPAGTGCSFFSATKGIDFVAQQADVRIVHRDSDGRFVNVTDGNKCLPDNGVTTSPLDQLMLLTGGDGTANPVTGEAHLAWDGTVTLNAYGGLLPWHLTDPELDVAADGTGTLSVIAGGLGASWEDPDDTHAVPDRRVTIATFDEVTLTDHGVEIDPDYAGVDYFPLQADGTRATESAIPAATKATTPGWGSWPASFVDFQYETGLSSYWHTSGLSADPDKSPHPIEAWYDGAPAVHELPAVVANPAVVDGALPLINGRSAVLRAQVDGADAVQWQRQVSGTWTDLAGATTPELRIDPVDTTWHNAPLRLRATNAEGSRATASYTVRTANYVAPGFSRQPVSTDVVADNLLSVGFTTVGTPAIDAATVALQREVGEGWVAVEHESASTSTVRLTSVPEEWDGDRFRVVASSIEGEETVSAPFTLTVHPNLGRPQVVVVPGTNLDPAVETTVTLLGSGFRIPEGPSANASYSLDVGLYDAEQWPPSGADDPRSRWIATSTGSSGGQLYRGALENSGGSFRITLKVPAGRLDPEGSYGVGTFLRLTDSSTWANSFESRAGDTWTPVPVGTQERPVFDSAPADVTLTAPAAARTVPFAVDVTGSPAPEVTWQTRRPGEPWTDATVTGAAVDLPVTSRDDQMLVRAVATGAGVAVSPAATVRLTERATTTTLAASAPAQAYGAPASGRVGLVATVADTAAVSGGRVRFSAGTVELGTAAVADGRAVLALAPDLAVGTHRVVATYLPAEGSWLAGSESVAATVTVRRAPVALRATLKVNGPKARRALAVRIVAGTSATIPAKVTVRLRKPRSGSWTTRTVRVVDGVATLRVTARARGAYKVRALVAAGPTTQAAWSKVVTRTLR